MKNVQITLFSSSLFSLIRTECKELLCKFLYSVWLRENRDQKISDRDTFHRHFPRYDGLCNLIRRNCDIWVVWIYKCSILHYTVRSDQICILFFFLIWLFFSQTKFGLLLTRSSDSLDFNYQVILAVKLITSY